MSNPLKLRDESLLNSMCNWLVYDRISFGIVVPQYFPRNGDWTVPPFLNNERNMSGCYKQLKLGLGIGMIEENNATTVQFTYNVHKEKNISTSL